MRRLIPAVFASGVWSAAGLQALIVVPLVVQAAYVASHPRPQVAWWRIAAGYLLLMVLMAPALWEPATGAITRVLLPLNVGFNVCSPARLGRAGSGSGSRSATCTSFRPQR